MEVDVSVGGKVGVGAQADKQPRTDSSKKTRKIGETIGVITGIIIKKKRKASEIAHD